MDVVSKFRAQWDRVCAILGVAAGAFVLTVGWFRLSGTAYPAEQLPYLLSAGLGGLFLLGIASTLWLSADLRDEWRKLDAIEQAIRESGPADHAEAGEASSQPAPETRPIASVIDDAAPRPTENAATARSLP